MEIKKEIRDKIIDYILDKNLQESLKPLPEKGTYKVESNYELGVNDKIKNYVFVVSQVLTYHNYSISDKRYGLYAFDVNTGELSPDFESKQGCYVGFFNDLQILASIV